MPSGDVAVIIPAKNEAERIGATVTAARGLPGVDLVVVVDDGSADDTAGVSARAGARVVRHARNRGKAAAMATGADEVMLIEARAPELAASGSRHLLFLDADLGESAAAAGPLAEPVRAGTADMTIARFSNAVRLGGFGIVTATAGAGIQRATGWRPVQPLNGQRCLTRAAYTAALPLSPGWGVETGMTIDLLRQGMRIVEVEVPLSHRATGTDWRSQLHRLRQLRDVVWALTIRAPASLRTRGAGTESAARRADRADPASPAGR